VGRVALQIELARLLREQRPAGVLIEVPDAGHLPALRRSLAAWPLASWSRSRGWAGGTWPAAPTTPRRWGASGR